MRLEDVLIRRGKLTPEQVEKASAEGLSPRQWVDTGWISELDLLEARAEQFGCDWRLEIGDELLDPGLISQLPVEWARQHVLLPVRKDGLLAALTDDPGDLASREDLGLILGADLPPILAPRAVILKAIERCYYRKSDTAQDLLRNLERQSEAPTPARTSDDLLQSAEQAPVTQLINLILLEALKARASDVHIEPFADRLRVRYRIDGILFEQAAPPKHLEAALVSRLKVMARLDIAEKRLPQDGAARVRVGEREVDIRMSTLPVAEVERIVLRLLNRESTLIPLSDLGMPPGVLEQFRQRLSDPGGILLVTGPTGSGKTTTLYAALQELDKAHANILTIEDPIEYQLPQIGQIQVKPKIGLTFAAGLRHILRQDPDVVLVGEIRDLETAEIAVRASLTGHLVLSTLHTNDAVGAVLRLTDMGVEGYLLAASVRAAMAQRLVRKLCPDCRESVLVSAEEVEVLGSAGRALVGASAWRARGCAKCLQGYRGRVGLFELLVVGPAVQEAIRSGRSLAAIRQLAQDQGMRLLLHDAVEKIREGLTTVAEVVRTLGRSAADSPA